MLDTTAFFGLESDEGDASGKGSVARRSRSAARHGPHGLPEAPFGRPSSFFGMVNLRWESRESEVGRSRRLGGPFSLKPGAGLDDLPALLEVFLHLLFASRRRSAPPPAVPGVPLSQAEGWSRRASRRRRLRSTPRHWILSGSPGLSGQSPRPCHRLGWARFALRGHHGSRSDQQKPAPHLRSWPSSPAISNLLFSQSLRTAFQFSPSHLGRRDFLLLLLVIVIVVIIRGSLECKRCAQSMALGAQAFALALGFALGFGAGSSSSSSSSSSATALALAFAFALGFGASAELSAHLMYHCYSIPQVLGFQLARLRRHRHHRRHPRLQPLLWPWLWPLPSVPK